MNALGPYTLHRQLPFYEPMMSLVFWSATRAEPGGPCACTLALPRHDLPELPTYKTWTTEFESDAELMSRFDHPVILGVLAHGWVGYMPFVEMEPFAGVTLGRLLYRANRGLPVPAAVEIVQQLAIATAHVYERTEGTSAQRRSPALQTGTVLCARDGSVRLLPPFHRTWGVEMPSFLLPPWYYELGWLPPDRVPDECSYVFLLGTILYALVTGRTPYQLASKTTDRGWPSGDVPIPSEVAPGLHPLDDIVRASTAHDRAQRYRDLDRLAAALEPLRVMPAHPFRDSRVPTAAEARLQIAQLVATVDDGAAPSG